MSSPVTKFPIFPWKQLHAGYQRRALRANQPEPELYAREAKVRAPSKTGVLDREIFLCESTLLAISIAERPT
jgi:hypothetical protein